jgi:hypothetical protein
MVEFQQEEAVRAKSGTEAVSPEERARLERIATLELARSRAAADLGRATAPAHKAMLEQAIAALNAQLREVDPTRP